MSSSSCKLTPVSMLSESVNGSDSLCGPEEILLRGRHTLMSYNQLTTLVNFTEGLSSNIVVVVVVVVVTTLGFYVNKA